MAAAFNLVGCWAIYQLARREGEGDGLEALALYAWNPLVLVESAGNAHAEAVMLALALLGVLLMRQGRAGTGWAVLVVSAATKYLSGASPFR